MYNDRLFYLLVYNISYFASICYKYDAKIGITHNIANNIHLNDLRPKIIVTENVRIMLKRAFKIRRCTFYVMLLFQLI